MTLRRAACRGQPLLVDFDDVGQAAFQESLGRDVAHVPSA